MAEITKSTMEYKGGATFQPIPTDVSGAKMITMSQLDDLEKKALELKGTIDSQSPAPYAPGTSTHAPTGKDIFGSPVAAGKPTGAPTTPA